MPHETTQPSLLLRVRDPSDHGAWTEFEAKYRELVLRYCRRRGVQPADCEDVQQITWLHLAKGMRNFEYDPKVGRFRGYLGRVVRNAIARHFSRPNPANAALSTTMLAVTADSSPDARDVAWEQEWVDHHYRLALQTVRTIVDLRSVEVFDRILAGDSVQAVAEAFAMSPQAVHKVKQRIKARMQKLIAQQVRDEDDPDWTSTPVTENRPDHEQP